MNLLISHDIGVLTPHSDRPISADRCWNVAHSVAQGPHDVAQPGATLEP